MKRQQPYRVNLILQAIAANDVDQLRLLARSENGLMYDWLRRRAWPILLHTLDGVYLREKGSEKDLRDPKQISKDVERSLYYYPQDLTPLLKKDRQRELHDMLVEILWRNPRLHYYQGFHDICTCFMLVLGKREGIPAAENVALFFLRDAMLDSFDPVSRQLSLVTTLLKLEDPELHQFLASNNVMAFFTLSWVLTWFSHDITDFRKVVRLFDLFMASTPLMPVYVACAIVLSRRRDLLVQESDMVHTFLCNLPQDPALNVDRIAVSAIELERKFPPLELQKRSGIWLDDCSPVNTYDAEWRSLSAGQHPDRITAERYLSMPPHQREPWEDEVAEMVATMGGVAVG